LLDSEEEIWSGLSPTFESILKRYGIVDIKTTEELPGLKNLHQINSHLNPNCYVIL
jgi:hypothetical protein